ncbi:MAG: intracellular sulfur oxidation DsrE/DsrF family protein [Oceanicoccus sp.]|jgi:intracellular sulfur oxidation DsrE/DsrF family protein
MLQRLCLLLIVLSSLPAASQQPVFAEPVSPRYLAQIQVNTNEELLRVLQRAEVLLDSGDFKMGIDMPVVFLLHGPEARSLLSPNYKDNKSLADLAARLSAFNVVDIKVCKTWMGGEVIDEMELLPFVVTVPYFKDEERRLLEQQNYVYF